MQSLFHCEPLFFRRLVHLLQLTTHHYDLRYTFHIRIHPWCFRFCECYEKYNDNYLLLCYRSVSLIQNSSLFHIFVSPFSQSLMTSNRLLSTDFSFSRMRLCWNHTALSLIISASFTSNIYFKFI